MSTASVIVPLHRTIVAVDIVGSTTRTNSEQAWLRHAMYEQVEKALWRSGIATQHRDRLVDRGDGILVLVHPIDHIPKTVLFSTFIPTLAGLLRAHNDLWPEHRFQLRVAVHAGEVHYDANGPFGEAINLSCRLVEAPELKAEARRMPVPVILVVSDGIYGAIIRHGYHGIDAHTFTPLVNVPLGGHLERGWVNRGTVPRSSFRPGTPG